MESMPASSEHSAVVADAKYTSDDGETLDVESSRHVFSDGCLMSR